MTDVILDTEMKTPRKAEMPDRWPGEVKALLWLGIPMALTQLAQFAIYTIDVVMIGRLGPEDLAAASLGGVIFFVMWMIGFGPVMAVTPLVSQALGADQDDVRDARVSVRMVFWMIAAMFPFAVALMIFATPIMNTFGQDPALSEKAGRYVLALVFGWPFSMFVMTLRNFLAALGKTRVPLVLVIITTLINTGLNFIFIYGMFGVPRLELVGAGIASSLSYFLCFLMFAAYVSLDKEAKRFEIFGNFFRFHLERFKEVFKLGWPISITTVFEGTLFNACIFLMGIIGVMEVAAYQVALNVAALAFMLPWGLSMAGSVRIGLAVGAENKPATKRVGLITIGAAIIGIMMFAVPIALFPETVAGWYLKAEDPDNIEVLRLVALFLPIAAAFMFFDAIQVAANQLLRGLKDVTVPMVMAGISFWGIGFPVAAYLGLGTSVGAVGIWYGLLASLAAASVLLGGRFWWMVWRKGAMKTLVKAQLEE